jgi:hypothetical protein
VIPDPGSLRLGGEDHPASSDEHRQEGDEEASRRVPVAAMELREADQHAGDGHQSHHPPVAARGPAVEVGGEPKEESGRRSGGKRRQSSIPVSHLPQLRSAYNESDGANGCGRERREQLVDAGFEHGVRCARRAHHTRPKRRSDSSTIDGSSPRRRFHARLHRPRQSDHDQPPQPRRQAETVRPYRFENHDITVFASQVSTDYLHMVDFGLERARRGFLSRRSIESVEDGLPTGASSTVTGDARPRASGGVAPDRTGPSVCYVVDDQGSGEIQFDRDTVEGLLAGGSFFWLDLDHPNEGDFQIPRCIQVPSARDRRLGAVRPTGQARRVRRLRL